MVRNLLVICYTNKKSFNCLIHFLKLNAAAESSSTIKKNEIACSRPTDESAKRHVYVTSVIRGEGMPARTGRAHRQPIPVAIISTHFFIPSPSPDLLLFGGHTLTANDNSSKHSGNKSEGDILNLNIKCRLHRAKTHWL